MKTRVPFINLQLLICIILSACGTSQVSMSSAETQAAAKIFATLTAQAPTATRVTTNTPMPKSTPTPITGWNKFESSGIEIWLPESYEGGDLENDTEVIINRMKALGPEFEQMANNIEKNPSMVKLIAVDTNIGDTGFVTNINIGREQILSTMTFDMYMETMKKQLPSFWTIIDEKKVQLDQHEALRLVSRLDISGEVMKQLQYLVKNNNTLWIITSTTTLEEFDERLPIFEQVVGTVKIQP